jgi:hypothetical protein
VIDEATRVHHGKAADHRAPGCDHAFGREPADRCFRAMLGLAVPDKLLVAADKVIE